MEAFDHRLIKAQARQCLEKDRWAYRKTVLFHSFVTMLTLVLVALADLALSQAVSHTGGLSGIGTRTILETAQTTLSAAVNILLPFWSAGILYTSLRVVRNQPVENRMLTRGFQRVGPLLRHGLLMLLIYFAAAMVCGNVVMLLSGFLPANGAMETLLSQLDLSDPTGYATALGQASPALLLQAMLPAMLLFLAVYCGVLLWLHYRLRMSQYLLVDELPMGAMAAMLLSNRMTKGSKWKLFRLDLSFWWYYLLIALISLTVYVPELLALLGVTLPLPAELANLIFYLVYALLTLAMSWVATPYLQTAYAMAYTALLPTQG